MSAAIRRVGVVTKRGLAGASEHLSSLERWLRERGVETVFEADIAAIAGKDSRAHAPSRDELPHDVDLVIVLGGDGTLLSMATRIAQAERDIPILGVNFGSLGFLTEVRIDELYPTLDSVVNGTAEYHERAMLVADACRGGECFDSRIVLNDVVFTKAALSRMIELSVVVSDVFVTKVRADGLIVASATGSTAYNLAAGGPILHPDVDAFVLTPIAPHTLTNRPVVIPGTSSVEIRPQTNGEPDDIYVTYDGQYGYPLENGAVVRVRKSEHRLRLVRAPARSYFELLREKLKWGERGGRE